MSPPSAGAQGQWGRNAAILNPVGQAPALLTPGLRVQVAQAAGSLILDMLRNEPKDNPGHSFWGI